ncbi:MAG: TlpA family protein disulfide reductase [Polyangiaceae bacterium]
MVALLVAGCRTTDGSEDSKKDEPAPAPTNAQPTATQPVSTHEPITLPPVQPRANRPEDAPKLVDAPATGDVAAIVKAEAAQAQGPLVVLVGAKWCEPCQRFHHAVEQGDLDDKLPGFTFLTFDLDRDQERLVPAGYVSHFIPLFVVPGPDGRASKKRIEGSITGPGSPGEITPRLLALVKK